MGFKISFAYNNLEDYEMQDLWSIVSMLAGLIKANSDYRWHEGSSE
jgi:hypothetical protein